MFPYWVSPGIPLALPVIGGVGTFLLFLLYISQALEKVSEWVWRPCLSKFPMMGKPGDRDLTQAILEGYEKYPDSPFVIPTKPPRVILPISMFNEAMHAPETSINFYQDVRDTFAGNITGAGTDRPEIIHTIRRDLTKGISSMLPMVQEEARNGFDQEIGSPPDWVLITLYHILLRIVAMVSGRVFVGLPLSRLENWITMSIAYTLDLAKVKRVMGSWHLWLRPIVSHFLPCIHRVKEDLRKAQEWMEPLITDLMVSDSRDDEKKVVAKAGSRGSFMSWMLARLPEKLRNVQRLASNQMLITFASIHTTSMTATSIILDLAARPEYIEPLRQEICEVLGGLPGDSRDKHGSYYVSKAAIAKMKKLDSFVKESQRMSPLGLISGTRRLLKTYKFSNGVTLPRGTSIAFPAFAIHHSLATETHGSSVNQTVGNKPPTEFDGFRFARLREVPGNEARYQAVTTNEESLMFGHGPHACPGRFFAIYEIKVILLEFLREYDFRLVGDVEGIGGVEKRPKNIVINGTNMMPDMSAKIQVRKRVRLDLEEEEQVDE